MYARLYVYNADSTKLKPNYSSYLMFQYCILHKHNKTCPTTSINKAILVQTTEKNASNFTANEVRRANTAKNLCRRIESLSM